MSVTAKKPRVAKKSRTSKKPTLKQRGSVRKSDAAKTHSAAKKPSVTGKPNGASPPQKLKRAARGHANPKASVRDLLEQRTAELAVINSIQRGLANRLEFQSIVDLVGDKIRDIFHHSDVWIRVYDAASHTIHCPYIV